MPTQRRWRRRDAVTGGLIMAATAVAAPRAAAWQATIPTLPGDDIPVLERLLRLELALAVAYESAAASDLLDSEVRPAAELFADQEREHAAVLMSALIDLDGKPPRPPTADEIDGLGRLDSQDALLEFLAGRESEAIALYAEAATLLEAPHLLKTGAQIVGNEAQHLAVLRQQLGKEAVPEAFAIGIAGERGSAAE
jgi:rubrerythrin